MKNKLTVILAMLMVLTLSVCMTACGDKEDAGEDAADQQTAEEQQDTESKPKVVATIEGIDDDLSQYQPMQIQSITLFEDGSVAIVPIEDLKKNEIKDDSEALYPFEESGKVNEVYVVPYGNDGYRTVLALMEDGTISAINGNALIEDHIIAVMDGVAGRDNFTAVEEREDDSGHYIIGITDDDQEVDLDFSLNF